MNSVDLSLWYGVTGLALLAIFLTVFVARQRQMQSALRLSEEKFSKAVGFSPDAVTLSHVSDGRFIEVNDSFSSLTGYSRQEALGRTSIELGLWDDPGDRQALLQRLQNSGSVRNQEMAFRHKDGQRLYTLLSTAVFQLDRQPCLLTVARDITEWKQAQTRLQRLAERDRLIAETAMRIHRYFDLDDILNVTVTEVRQVLNVDRAFIHQIHQDNTSTIVAEARSETAASLLGQEAEIPTQGIRARMEQSSVVQVDDVSAIDSDCPYRNFVQRYGTQAAMGAAILIDNALFGVLVVHQCHRPRPWLAHESKLLAQVSTQMAIAIKQAILQQKLIDVNLTLEQQVGERTAQLKQRMQELQERNQLLDFFLHAVSHDLRTSALGSLMTLQSLASPDKEGATIPSSVLRRMRQGAEQQLQKLESLQDIYKAKAVGLELMPTAMALVNLVSPVVDELTPLIIKNQAQIILQLPEDLPSLWVDAAYIRQVFYQLILNAILHNAPEIKITITAWPQGDRLYCRVEDNGCGISPALRDRLFELCTDRPKVHHYGRICLGLYRCRQIVEAHQGAITAHAAEPGTAIELALPLAQ